MWGSVRNKKRMVGAVIAVHPESEMGITAGSFLAAFRETVWVPRQMRVTTTSPAYSPTSNPTRRVPHRAEKKNGRTVGFLNDSELRVFSLMRSIFDSMHIIYMCTPSSARALKPIELNFYINSQSILSKHEPHTPLFASYSYLLWYPLLYNAVQASFQNRTGQTGLSSHRGRLAQPPLAGYL